MIYGYKKAAALVALAAVISGQFTPVNAAANYVNAAESDAYDTIVIGYSQIGSESDWRLANTESVLGAFNNDNRFYLIYDNAQQMQEKQVKALRDYVLQGVDYIILNPIVETGWDSALQEVHDAGIPIILADRAIQLEDDDLYTCWIGSDFLKEGISAGEWLEKYLQDNKRSDDPINIAILEGTVGSSAQIGRYDGFMSIAKKHPNWNIIAREEGDFTQAKGEEAMNKILSENIRVDVLLSENDNMTFGAIDAIKAAGLTCGPDGDITILSFDATLTAFDQMIAGNINVTFECNPLDGDKLKDAILTLEAGEEVEKIQYVEETYFDTSMDLEEIKKTRTY